MRVVIKKIFCFLLITAILLTAFSFMPAKQAEAEALDFTDIQSKLNTWQYYFCRTFMSLALKDYYDTGILPSITVGQALYEGGCAGHPISVIGKNHYGIKAYPSLWSGPIYDDKEYILYNSYNDLVNIKGEDYARKASIWRAYSTWEEGVKGHSDLFAEEKKYTPVFEAADYIEAANAIMNAGYAGNSTTYAGNLINFIEKYNFRQLDHVTEDENGIFGIVMSKAEVSLDIGETLQMDTTAYPETEYDYRSETVWTSDKPEVVTVDETGLLTAVGHGYALVTANYGEKEACCIVAVGCNATAMTDRDFTLYAEPDSDSDSMGKLLIGQPIHVNSKTIFEGVDGNAYYAVTAMNSSGKVVSGYGKVENIYTGGDIRVSVGTPLTILHLEVDSPYEIPLEIHAEELKEKAVTWASSDEEILTVDENGVVSPLSEGVAIVSVLLDGEVSLTVTVYVGEAGYADIIATSAVYVRDACDGKSNVIGLVRKGHSVKLLCDLGDGWYRVLANVEGEYVIGYSYSRYYRFPWEPDPDESSDSPSTDPSADPSTDPSGDPSESSDISSGDPYSDPSGDFSDDTSGTTSGETVVILLSTGEVDVDNYLNVRKTAGTQGERLIRIPNGTPVVIQSELFLEEETTYKEWYKVTFTFEKKNYEGFVAAEFIRLVGTTEKTVPDEPIKSERYTKDDIYLYGILPKTEKTAFLKELGRTALLYRANGKAIADGEILHTGDKIDFYIGEFYVYTRTVIVFGDVSGDGQINAVDYTAVKAQVIRTYELSDEQKKAAAVAGKETISALDYLLLKAIVLGTHTLE